MHNLEAMKAIVAELYTTMVVQQHGSRGAVALKHLLQSLHRIYDQVAPESRIEPFIVFKALDDASRPLPLGEAVTVRRIESLAQAITGPAVLQILDNGQILLWKQKLTGSVGELAAKSVVYEYRDANEFFYAKDEVRVVLKPFEGCISIFALPTFSKLREALEHYRTVLARYSTCEILRSAWFDSNRLHFKEKPEKIMRRSLTQYLISTLRHAEPRPEQIVDETHPVDIKVTFMHTNRLALIEIKWLGHSLHPDGAAATPYSAVRARAGAQQLAEYLDSNKPRAPDHVTRGYLVVFDGRRKGLKPNAVTISRADGMHYSDREIDYSPQHHVIRGDFDEPIRMFLEPICGP